MIRFLAFKTFGRSNVLLVINKYHLLDFYLRLTSLITVMAVLTMIKFARQSPHCKVDRIVQHCGLLFSAAPDSIRNRNTTKRNMGTQKVSLENMNPHIIKMQYAVRGPLVARALEIEKELSKGVKKPFDEVIKANIGDCHAMGQKPITFIRQVLACVAYPKLIESSEFPSDVRERAKLILSYCGGQSVGSYSISYGVEIIRRHCAEYITKRDGGIPSNWQDICLCGGASDGIKNLLKIFNTVVDGKPPGVMIPIPQYPLYSASLAEYGYEQVQYYLNEEKNWALDIEELERSLKEANAKTNVRALVIINPGNPTGQVLSRENIEGIIKFAHKNNLFLIADEVYQDNVYAKGSEFHSFKKVATQLGKPYSEVQLASFMSASKGYMGECGLRGGYMELLNMDPDVQAMLFKCISAMLCPTVLGQTVIDCVAKPPVAGDPSYELFLQEKTAVLGSLKERARMVVDTFNKMEGFKCNVVQGAMYAFPQITLPPKAIEAAKKDGKPADAFYAFALLEKTGICIVPGSGFGQRPGTYHFRTTILPQTDKLKKMLEAFQRFHKDFCAQYA